MSRVARLDQYYPHVRCVAPYQAARKQAFERRQVPPSTSVIVSGLQDIQAEVDVQVIAATIASGYSLREVDTGLNRPEASGYAPCLRVGDLIFVAGQLARDASGRLAAHGVEAETDYVVKKRLIPALEASGSALDLVLKAQVYISQPKDVPAFWQRWKQAFGTRLPPTTVVPVRHPDFLTSDATIEINVVAAHESARARVREVEGARVLDGLLFVGGLTGLNALEHADLSHVVRGLFFQSHPGELPDPGFPYSAFEVQAGPIVDLWGYVP